MKFISLFTIGFFITLKLFVLAISFAGIGKSDAEIIAILGIDSNCFSLQKSFITCNIWMAFESSKL